MAKFAGKDAAAGLEKAFGIKIEDFTTEQLWVLTKLSKYVRMRAKSNVAFNNYMNGIFTGARFEKIQKQNHRGETYDGLQITVKGVKTEEEEDDA